MLSVGKNGKVTGGSLSSHHIPRSIDSGERSIDAPRPCNTFETDHVPSGSGDGGNSTEALTEPNSDYPRIDAEVLTEAEVKQECARENYARAVFVGAN